MFITHCQTWPGLGYPHNREHRVPSEQVHTNFNYQETQVENRQSTRATKSSCAKSHITQIQTQEHLGLEGVSFSALVFLLSLSLYLRRFHFGLGFALCFGLGRSFRLLLWDERPGKELNVFVARPKESRRMSQAEQTTRLTLDSKERHSATLRANQRFNQRARWRTADH